MSDISIGIHLPGLAAAKKGIAGIRDDFDRLGKSKGAQSLLMGVGLAAGQMAFNALGSAVSAATDFMADSISKASDLREAMALSEQVFEGNTAAVNDWAEGAAEAFGQSTREALNFASGFGTAFKNVGLSLDETTEKSEALTRLAADLGSAFNRSADEAATALRSGLLGESEPLRRFGVFLDEAKVKAKALAMGMKPVNGAFTDAQKVTARYRLILEQTTDSQGMFGRDTGSLADAQKSLAAEVENLQAGIGQDLLPVMRDLSVWMRTEGIPLLKGFLDVVGELGPATVNYSESVKGASATGREWAATMKAGRDAADEGSKAVTTFDRVNTAWASRYQGQADAFIAKNERVQAGLVDTATHFKRIRDRADEAAQNAEDLADAMDDIAEAAYGPEQLVLQLEIAKDELGEDLRAAEKLRAKIERFKELGKPVGELEDDYRDLRLEISEGREEVFRLTTRTMALDGLSMDEIRQQFNALGNRAGYAADEIRRAYLAARKLAGVGLGGINPSPRGGNFALAGGGFAPVGSSGTVGEEGMERMVVTPMGAFVTPMGRGGGGGASGPVVIQLQLDGRTVAEVVDRHLAYMAARAPQSPYSG